jgi:hypothetical protein
LMAYFSMVVVRPAATGADVVGMLADFVTEVTAHAEKNGAVLDSWKERERGMQGLAEEEEKSTTTCRFCQSPFDDARALDSEGVCYYCTQTPSALVPIADRPAADVAALFERGLTIVLMRIQCCLVVAQVSHLAARPDGGLDVAFAWWELTAGKTMEDACTWARQGDAYVSVDKLAAHHLLLATTPEVAIKFTGSQLQRIVQLEVAVDGNVFN